MGFCRNALSRAKSRPCIAGKTRRPDVALNARLRKILGFAIPGVLLAVRAALSGWTLQEAFCQAASAMGKWCATYFASCFCTCSS